MQRRINQKLSEIIHEHEHENGQYSGRGGTTGTGAGNRRSRNDEHEYEDDRNRSRNRTPGPTPTRSKSLSVGRRKSSESGAGNKIFRSSSNGRSNSNSGSTTATFRNPNWESQSSKHSRDELLDIEEENEKDLLEGRDSDEDFIDDDGGDDDFDEEDLNYTDDRLPYDSRSKKIQRTSSSRVNVNVRKSGNGIQKANSLTTRTNANARKPSKTRSSNRASRTRTTRTASRNQVRIDRDREIMPLSIGFSDSIHDIDTYRKYLSRSDSANFDKLNSDEPPIPCSSKISTGGGSGAGGPTASTTAKKSTASKNSYTSLIFNRRVMALSQAILTLALLSASCSQLRFIYSYSSIFAYPGLNYFLICSSIFIEIFVGIGYIILARYNFSEPILEKFHSYLIFGLFYVAISTVILSAFGLENHICELLIARKAEKEFDTIDQSGGSGLSSASAPVAPLNNNPTLNLQPMPIQFGQAGNGPGNPRIPASGGQRQQDMIGVL